MLLSELLEGLSCVLCCADGGLEITRPFSDSRRAVCGGLFLCICGTKTSGELFVREALEKGAAAIVTDAPVVGVPSVVVRDTRYAAAVIWNNFYKRPAEGMRLWGITGTNGKTSTAVFLKACLEADGRRVGIIGTLGCFAGEREVHCAGSEKFGFPSAMTTPDPEYLYGVLREFQNMGMTDVVMEVSSHSIAQRKTDALRFFAGVFTNLSPEHLDFHKSMEEYFRVKASFVSRCEIRIVNEDDGDCRRFCASVPSVAVGKKNVSSESITASGVKYKLSLGNGEALIEARVGGGFTVYNTLLAAAAAVSGGVPLEKVKRGIFSVTSVEGRLERVFESEPFGFDVIIDYAHTPAALESVLLHLRKSARGRVICVFGCGGDRDKSKRPLMGLVAQRLADGVIVTSDNPRGEDPEDIIRDIVKGMSGDNAVVVRDRKKAIFRAVSMARAGDVVLLAGKGHEKYEIVGEKKTFFDEREVVKEALFLKTTVD